MIAWIATLFVTVTNVHSTFTTLDSPTPQSSCLNTDGCRTLAEVVSPAVTALIAAIYLCIHQNVPRPDGSHWYWNTLRSALLAGITLVFPEWMCAWAVRNYIIARRLLPRIEAARSYVMDKWYDKAISGENTPLACKQLYFLHTPLQSD